MKDYSELAAETGSFSGHRKNPELFCLFFLVAVLKYIRQINHAFS